MANTWVVIEKFDGKSDLFIWKEKMRAILVQQKCHRALEGEASLPETLSKDDRLDLMDLAYSTILLNLFDSVLRRVRGNDTAPKLWDKLNSLYMITSIYKIAFLKEKLFSFKMISNKSVDENYDDFKH